MKTAFNPLQFNSFAFVTLLNKHNGQLLKGFRSNQALFVLNFITIQAEPFIISWLSSLSSSSPPKTTMARNIISNSHFPFNPGAAEGNLAKIGKCKSFNTTSTPNINNNNKRIRTEKYYKEESTNNIKWNNSSFLNSIHKAAGWRKFHNDKSPSER